MTLAIFLQKLFPPTICYDGPLVQMAVMTECGAKCRLLDPKLDLLLKPEMVFSIISKASIYSLEEGYMGINRREDQANCLHPDLCTSSGPSATAPLLTYWPRRYKRPL